MTEAEFRAMCAPIPSKRREPLLVRLAHRIRCNDRVVHDGRLRGCSLCSQTRNVR